MKVFLDFDDNGNLYLVSDERREDWQSWLDDCQGEPDANVALALGTTSMHCVVLEIIEAPMVIEWVGAEAAE